MAQRFSISRRKLLLGLALTGLAGCRGIGTTEDPQLKPIKAMLEQQLPPRTPEDKVVLFLDNHGYQILAAQKQGTIVANIRRTDTAAVQPVTARVTFYFDANRRLNTIEVQRPVSEPGKR
ncbi:MAG TPA: hypothetical protein VNH19_19265 [Candidatus Limnocylindrales bacterium]|nr:hypothetical protein [Candidatus Limnocylindrales bacterium]